MRSASRFDALPDYPFPRLRALLAGIAPGGPELSMSIGEPRHAPPAAALEALARHAHEYGKYPPIEGTPGFRAAVTVWANRRYGLPAGFLEPDKHVLPLNGTREGLFMAAVALVPERRDGQKPAVLLPNPFYQCYAAAAVAAGAEPIFIPATRETGHLPDFAGLPQSLWDRVAFVYLCSPANPQGAVASKAYLADLLARCARVGAVLAADECYAEIYTGAPPAGALEAAAAAGAELDHLLVFHSLSKRSNLPGLRSGFVAGGERLIAEMRRLRSYGGAPNPLPALHAAEAAWRDEAHAIENRRLYAEKFDLADQILGGLPGYERPQGGFFLWLDVGDGEAAARRLWAEHGVRALPGAYLARAVGDEPNPGARYLRAALVDGLDDTRRGLHAIRKVMAG